MWHPEFPRPELVEAAADLLPTIREAGGRGAVLGEGPRWELVISPGVIRVRTQDYARAERAQQRAAAHRRAQVDMEATFLAEGREVPRAWSRGRIVVWSRKSRARLVARLSDLDYTRLYGRYHLCASCSTSYDPDLVLCPQCGSGEAIVVERATRLPAMLTLTYPGDWLSAAPTGRVVKGHLAALRQRYVRAWGEPLIAVWKLEFQARGAPHIHLSTTPPMGEVSVTDPGGGQRIEVDFRRWLSIVWADIVAHPDPEQRRRHLAAGTRVDYAEGIRMSNPRRMAIYFAKYGTSGSKEYQHQVPIQWQADALACTVCDHERLADQHSCPQCGAQEAKPVDQGRGPGRFWGYWGLRPLLAARHVSVRDGIAAGRLLRRWYRAQGRNRATTVTRVNQATGRVRHRRCHQRKHLLAHNRGFVIVRDGPAMAIQLARYLSYRRAV